MQEKSEFILCNSYDYKLTYEALAPDGVIHQVVYNDKRLKNGYIHNKKTLEDDIFYSPYLIHKIGQKTGINMPETELGIIIHLDRDRYFYRDCFFESSIVYDENLGHFESFSLNTRSSHVSQEVAFQTYLMENPDTAEKRRNELQGRAMPQTIDDYVNSNIYFLTSRGSKPRQEYSKAEIDAMKQELIDRALFSLKFGANGNFDITLFDNKNARLDPYYLSNRNWFSLNVNEEWITGELEKDEQFFKSDLDKEYSVQYGIKPNTKKPSPEELLNYIFENYPEQAEKSYKKLSGYSLKDFETDLANCSKMSEHHKKFAMRSFEIREKIFEQLYRQHLRHKIK